MGWFNFLKRDLAQAEEAKWSVKRAETDKEALIIRKNDSAGTPKNRSIYPMRVGFAYPFRSADKAGKLSDNEQAQVYAIEDLLVKRLEKDGNAIQVLSVRGAQFQELIFYAKESFAKKTKFDEILKEVKSHKVQTYQAPDSKWSTYDSM